MRKIAIAVMLLATSAFGAVSLSSTPEPVQINPGGSGVIQLTLDTNETIAGLGIYPYTDASNAVKISGRTIQHSVLSDATTSVLPDAYIDQSYSLDIGVTSNVAAGTSTGGNLMTLTLTTAAGAVYTAANPLVLTLYGNYAYPAAVGGGGDFAPVTVSIVPVPEPASMLLLAAGAAFFARRRRA